eukprot:2585933-Prymnesium_polylepis.1
MARARHPAVTDSHTMRAHPGTRACGRSLPTRASWSSSRRTSDGSAGIRACLSSTTVRRAARAPGMRGLRCGMRA